MELETMTIWYFDRGRARAVSTEAFLIEGTWYTRSESGFVNEIYGRMFETERECLEAELATERRYVQSAQERCRRIEGLLMKAKVEA